MWKLIGGLAVAAITTTVAVVMGIQSDHDRKENEKLRQENEQMAKKQENYEQKQDTIAQERAQERRDMDEFNPNDIDFSDDVE